ncbi:MAG TPA: stage V sporulation protein AB [Candidatus Merdenecus merdavium]|nr:stage V sporulation protein AB [Candidatus Merdenecus merdavium]
MWMNQVLLGILGFSSGIVVAGGAIALIVGLGIVPRFAGVTHTGHRVRLYEDCILLGAILGNIMFVYQISIFHGTWLMILFGIFSGMFLGSWIIALAEVINTFPIFARRIKITKGVPLIVISIAVGKVLGSILHFAKRW